MNIYKCELDFLLCPVRKIRWLNGIPSNRKSISLASDLENELCLRNCLEFIYNDDIIFFLFSISKLQIEFHRNADGHISLHSIMFNFLQFFILLHIKRMSFACLMEKKKLEIRLNGFTIANHNDVSKRYSDIKLQSFIASGKEWTTKTNKKRRKIKVPFLFLLRSIYIGSLNSQWTLNIYVETINMNFFICWLWSFSTSEWDQRKVQSTLRFKSTQRFFECVTHTYDFF